VKLSQKTANELIKLLEVLASHSITSYELKHVFLLIREDADLKVSSCFAPHRFIAATVFIA
jgi:hypothetical protein